MKFESIPEAIVGHVTITGQAKIFNRGKLLASRTYSEQGGSFKSITLPCDWGNADLLQILLTVEYQIHTLGQSVLAAMIKESKGKFIYSGNWTLLFKKNSPILHWWRIRDHLNYLEADKRDKPEGPYAISNSVNHSETPAAASTQNALLTVKILGGYTKDGLSVGVKGINVPITSPEAVKFKTKDLDFSCKLWLSGRPAPTKPEPKTAPRSKYWVDLLYGVNQFECEGDVYTRLQDFVAKIPEGLYKEIQKGHIPISLYGYASKPGTDEWNQNLSEKRIRGVENRLKKEGFFDSNKLVIFSIPHGDTKTSVRGLKSSAQKVEVRIYTGN